MMDFIPKFIAKHVLDRCKRAPLVVSLKVLDVLQEKGVRSMMRDDLGKVKEEGALGIAEKAVRPSQGVLL